MNQLVQPAFSGLVETDAEGIPRQRIAPLAERRLITEFEEIPFEGFAQLFKEKAGESWKKIEDLFKEYGPVLSIQFVSAVMYAEEDGRLDWCMELLQKHLSDDLQFQHPELRGRLVTGSSTQNRSEHFIEQEIIKVLRPQFFISN